MAALEWCELTVDEWDTMTLDGADDGWDPMVICAADIPVISPPGSLRHPLINAHPSNPSACDPG